MKSLVVRASLVALLIVVAAAGTVSANGPATPGRGALLDELGRARTVVDADTGNVSFVGGSRARPAAPAGRFGARGGAQAVARAFGARYGSLFGVRAGDHGVAVERSQRRAGATFVRLRQVQAGVPVIAGELIVQVDDAGNVISAAGEATASTVPATKPGLAAAEAAAIATAAVSDATGIDSATLAATAPELSIYDPALLGVPGRPGARLVWRTEVGDALRTIDQYVLVDALSGAIALRFEQLAHARNRTVCDARKKGGGVPCVTAARTETSGASGVTAVNTTFNYMGQFYAFFSNRFGLDSIDGAGMPLVATVRHCESGYCASPNAYWNGEQAVFWPGLASDDVVAHEFAHGFTEFHSNLAYVYQSGAINEALSDIFGEMIDLTNGTGTDTSAVRWVLGEDTSIGAIRNMKHPPALGQPDRMTSSLYDPDPDFWDNGGVHTNSGVANKAAFLMVDGGTFNGRTVAALGIDRTAAIWFHTAVTYLASGSDYEDLGHALGQACDDLLDQPVRNSAGTATGSIGADDCQATRQAVAATEMASPPSVSGAGAPEAPLCQGGSAVDVLNDPIGEGAPGWSFGGSSGVWEVDSIYATSKPFHLWGWTPDAVTDGWAGHTDAIAVPPDAFLHFRHYYAFQVRRDGAVVEYQVDDGAWLDAGPLFSHQGYDGTISTAYGNPLAGRSAFTRWTVGYISSRLNLASLAGANVRFRFRVASDATAGYGDGWMIDDVRLYTCTASSDGEAPTVDVPNPNLRQDVQVGGRRPVKLTIGFSADDASGLQSTALERRTGSGRWSAVAMAATATSVNLDYVTSGRKKRQFRATATDSYGNTSAWQPSAAFKVLAAQNGAAAIVQSGSGWKTHSRSSFYGGSVRHSASANASQSLTRTMSDVAIVTTLGPNRGMFDVYIDGALVTPTPIDTYSATVKYRQVVFAWDFESAGPHTIELRVVGDKNVASTGARVDLDAFLVLAP